MYRVVKAFNHNAVLAADVADQKEYLLMGKGIGFGKKVSEQFETDESCRVYSLTDRKERNDAQDLAKSINPEFLEIANMVLDEAEKVFGQIDRNILFPLADHISYAVERIRRNETISNPLTEDIRVLFHMEYKVASCVIPLLESHFGISISEDEVGYITLHVHSAIDDEKVSDAMQTARAVRECIRIVEESMGKKIDVMTLSYNRLMNHVRYMIVRALEGEKLKLSLNDYMQVKYPEEFALAAKICDEFYMADKSRARKEGGAGIGMSLVAIILEHHNAVLSVESEPGCGTTMRILLPW